MIGELKGTAPATHWTDNRNGLNQVAYLYTAQSFGFDYVGVIWSRDLRWEPATNDFIGDPSESHDSIVERSDDRFTDLLERTFCVLLTVGHKRCCVICEHPKRRRFQASPVE